MSEILFDRACIFLHKGYYREAIFNFFGSLEKFKELFITYSLIKNDIPSDKIAQLFKEISLSERQHGAYRLIQLLERQTDLTAHKQWEKLTQLRNKIIHAGKLPTENEAHKFGTDTLELIEHDYSYLRNKKDFSATLIKEIFLQNIPVGNNPGITIVSPGFQLIGLNDKNYSFDSILENIKKFIEDPDTWYYQQ